MSRALHLPVAVLQEVVDEKEFQEQQAYDLINLDERTEMDVRFALLYKMLADMFRAKNQPETKLEVFLGLIEYSRQQVQEKFQNYFKLHKKINPEQREAEKQKQLEYKFKYLESLWISTGRIKKE